MISLVGRDEKSKRLLQDDKLNKYLSRMLYKEKKFYVFKNYCSQSFVAKLYEQELLLPSKGLK